jgi:hypothetical protein
MRGSRTARTKKRASAFAKNLDDELRALLRGTWTFETAPPALLALGRPALDRLLDATDGVFFPTYTEWRDYGMYRQHAVAAFANADMDGVLSAMKKRKWTDAAVARSGVGLVQDGRVVPFLVRAYADREPPRRQYAIEYLGNQRDPRATETVLRALKDRSSAVRLAAIRALGQIGEPQAISALRAIADRDARSLLVEQEIKEALRKIRKASRSR